MSGVVLIVVAVLGIGYVFLRGPMSGVVLIVVAVLGIGYVFLRYPDFRRAFVEHWRPAAIATRMDEWVKRAKR